MHVSRRRRLSLFVLLMALTCAMTLARAATAQVRDEAGFFSPDAVRQASFDLRDIQQRFGVDLLIDTVPGVPPEMREQFEAIGREKFFAQWSQQRAREAGLSGAIVLISNDPSYLRVTVGRHTQQQAFTPDDADQLRDVMLTAFKARQYDQGLLQGVATFRRTLQRNLGDGAIAQPRPGVERAAQDRLAAPTDRDPSRAAPASPAPEAGVEDNPDRDHRSSLSTIIIWAVLIVGGTWLIRRLFAGRRAPTRPGGYGYLGHGYPTHHRNHSR